MKLPENVRLDSDSGHTTLDLLSNAKQFNRWIYESIKPWIKGEVIEIGSGIGSITSLMIHDGFKLMISETKPQYLQILKERYVGNLIRDIIELDIVDVDFDNKFHYLFESFDTLIANNVIEHIKDDQMALHNAKKLLKQGGRLIVLLPNAECLYNRLDENLHHYRRYNKRGVKVLFEKNNLDMYSFKYFNTIGILGWYFSGSIFRQKIIPKTLLRIFEQIIPLTSWLDILFKNHLGLSIIAVGKKKS